MLSKSFGLLFFLKQPQNSNCKRMYVYLRITVNGTSKELSLKRMWEHGRWNAENGKASGTKEDAKALNNFLEAVRSKVYDAKIKLLEANKTVTADALKNLLIGKDENKKMILEIFKQHNEQVRELVGRDFAPGTLGRYCTSLEHTHSFIKWKYKVDDLDIKQLNYEFISEYCFWLKSVRNCSHNTTMKYLSNFKKIVLRCVRNGWLSRDPFSDFKMSKKEVVRTR
jgi:hypothetical protein